MIRTLPRPVVMRSRAGLALINVLCLAMVSSLFLMAASSFVAQSMREGRKVRVGQQAYNVAQAGLNEALSWLRKQDIKPVIKFDIVEDAGTADPETWDEQIGLVKEWEVDESQDIWARFEVGRCADAPARSPIAIGLGSATHVKWQATDISRQRGFSSAGTVWLLRCRGLLYKRPASATSYATTIKPIESTILETEVQLTDFKGRDAAIYSYMSDSDASTIAADGVCGQTGGHIQFHAHGGSAGNARLEAEDGIAYNIWANSAESKVRLADGDGSTSFGPSVYGITTTTSTKYVDPDLTKQLEHCFGVSDLASTKALASYYYDAGDPPSGSLPQMSFTYIKAVGMTDDTMVFNSASPRLAGGGILFVEGNLAVDGLSTFQTWEGLVFVTGDYTQYYGTRLLGGLVCGGKVRVHGTAGEVAEIRYSRAMIDRACRKLATYREQRATLTTTANATPRPF